MLLSTKFWKELLLSLRMKRLPSTHIKLSSKNYSKLPSRRRSGCRVSKRLNIVKHISNPQTYATGTAVVVAAAAMPTAPGSPCNRPPLSLKTMMIEMLEEKREE
jgi:hypothetical protein